jgi:hypothetical protein
VALNPLAGSDLQTVNVAQAVRHPTGAIFRCASAAVLACLASGCHAQPAPNSQAGQPFAPAETRTFRSFGAAGDGRSDDSAAIERAFADSDRYCLDGEGRAYRVTGTLRVSRSLCMRNATFLQSAAPVDTSRYITRSCPVVPDPSAVVDCGDPAVPADQLDRLWKSLSVRTLLIRPSGNRPIEVNLVRVKVDRGPYEEGGARSDSAGIWLDGADRVDFRDVEITGKGKGYGLLISNARNVTLTNLWIHDLVWAPYRGDAPLSQARVAAIGWNAVPIHEFREQGRGGAGAAKFYGVRIQEQITCAFLTSVTHVRIEGARVERCMARFDTGNLPWQTDGLDIGRSSSDVTIDGAKVDSTWEGMDIGAGGSGVSGLTIKGLTVSNSFGFGLKLGYQLSNVRVSNLNVDGAGLAGVVLYGPVRDARIEHATIRNVGLVRGGRGAFTPWPAGNRSGIRFDEGSGANGQPHLTPDNVVLDDIAIAGNPVDYEYGILNTGGRDIRVAGFQAQGFGISRTRGLDQR